MKIDIDELFETTEHLYTQYHPYSSLDHPWRSYSFQEHFRFATVQVQSQSLNDCL